MEKNPKNNQRGIGDNSVDQSFGEWASASLDDAINYIVRLIRKNKRLEHQLNESINARNNLKRGIALSEAKKINDSISKDAKSLNLYSMQFTKARISILEISNTTN